MYVKGGPVRYTDPTGHWGPLLVVIVVVAVALVVTGCAAPQKYSPQWGNTFTPQIQIPVVYDLLTDVDPTPSAYDLPHDSRSGHIADKYKACTAVAIAMVLEYYVDQGRIDRPRQGTTPAEVVKAARGNPALGDPQYWDPAEGGIRPGAAGAMLEDVYGFNNVQVGQFKTEEALHNTLQRAMDSGVPLIVGVTIGEDGTLQQGNDHSVLVVGYSEGQVAIVDPMGGEIRYYDANLLLGAFYVWAEP